MNPRKPLSCWQIFAQGPALRKIGFASTREVLQHGASDDPSRPAHSNPFPTDWPGPLGCGPFSALGAVAARLGRNSAKGRGAAMRRPGIFPFASALCALESGDITTPIRGTSSCGKSSPFFSSQPRLQAACRTPAQGVWPVRSSARPLPMRRTKTCWPARPSAGLPALRPAPFRARSAVDQIGLTATAAGQTIKPATHGDAPRGWLFHFRPARAALT